MLLTDLTIQVPLAPPPLDRLALESFTTLLRGDRQQPDDPSRPDCVPCLLASFAELVEFVLAIATVGISEVSRLAEQVGVDSQLLRFAIDLLLVVLRGPGPSLQVHRAAGVKRSNPPELPYSPERNQAE